MCSVISTKIIKTWWILIFCHQIWQEEKNNKNSCRIVEKVFSGILLIVTEQYVSDGFLLHKDTTSLCALWCLQGLLLKDDT